MKNYITKEGPYITKICAERLQFCNHISLNRSLDQGSESGPKTTKGRKRKEYSQFDNLRELIEKDALPQWVKYLKKKMKNNEDKETGVTPRDDTIWKKIFRDLREFYRILFKSRFHPLDYKSGEQADE